MLAICLIVEIRPCFVQNNGIIEGYSDEEFCETIRFSEGARSRFPYGIKSVRCASQSQCKDVCIRTIRHYRKDFIKTHKVVDDSFIQYASKRYVESKDKIGQENWVKNVEYFLKRDLKENRDVGKT